MMMITQQQQQQQQPFTINNNYNTTPKTVEEEAVRSRSRRNIGQMLNKIKKSLLKRFGTQSQINNNNNNNSTTSTTTIRHVDNTCNDRSSRISWSLVMENSQAEFLYQNIFSWLDHTTVMRLSMVNRYMRAICVEFHPVCFRMEWWNLTEYKKTSCEFPFEKVIRVQLEGEPMLEYMPRINWENVQSLRMNVHYYKNVDECSKIIGHALEESSLLLRELVLNGKQREMNERFTLTNVLDKVNVRGLKLERLTTNLPVDVNRLLQYEMTINKIIIGEYFCTDSPSAAFSMSQSTSSVCCGSATSSTSKMNEIVQSTTNVNRTNQCLIKVFRCKVTEKNLKEFCALIAMPQFQTQILEITLTPALIAPEILSTLIDLFVAHLKHVKKVAIASSLDPLLLKKVFGSFRTNSNTFELVLVKKQDKHHKKC